MASGSTGKSVDFSFHNLSISSTTSGYGVQIQGNSPVVFSNVLQGSVADRAGVIPGDYLITLNGDNMEECTEDDVGSALQCSYGSALKVRVARPHPLPVTDMDKRRALLALQNKLRTGDFVTCGAEVDDYRSQLSNALSGVDDILGGFDLPHDQMVPSYGGTDQEVEIQMYDADNLSSPPSSKGSDTDLTGYDPLLDFSRDDGFDHQPGVKSVGAEMNSSVRKMQKEISNMKNLMKDVSDKKEKKKRSREQAMRTEAAFTPARPSHTTRTQPPVVAAAAKPDLSRELAELDELEEQIKWVTSPMGSGNHVTSNSDSRQRQAPKRTERSPPPRQVDESASTTTQKPERSLSPSSKQPVSLPSRQSERSTSPPSNASNKQPKQPKKTSKDQEKSPPVREPKRAKSPTARQPERGTSPPPTQPDRAVSPTSKAPGRIERFFRRSKSPQSQPERGVSPPAVKDKFSVPLRQKNKVVEQLPGMDASGYVQESHKKGANKIYFGHPTSDIPEKPLPDVADATSGLPDNIYGWSRENVGQWIKQLNMSLYAHYYPLFSKHQITGRTLLRLTSSKLKVMGINNSVHCRILATEIGKLKIRQEQVELRELQFDSDDETGIVSDV